MSERVLIDVDEHVARVTLNRPEKMNAIDADMFTAVAAVGERLRDYRDVRAVVLSGAGGHFCAGIDVSSFAQTDPAIAGQRLTASGDNPANYYQQPAYNLRALPYPVIAALSGNVLGGGLQIALGADIRLAAPDARLSVMEIKWGLIPDMAVTHTLRGLLTRDQLKELTFTGRLVDAAEAASLGLVTRVEADPLAAAVALAKTIAGRSPDAIRASKRLIDEAFERPSAEGLRLEATLQRDVLSGANHREAIAANVEKREPRFVDGG